MRAANNSRWSSVDRFRIPIFSLILLFAIGCNSESTKHKPDTALAKQPNEVEKSEKPRMPRKTNRLSNFSDILDPQHPIQCRVAVEWNDLFRRYEDWSGADGVYSMPLSGVQIPGQVGDSLTLFTFNDTLLGDVDRETFQRQKSQMVNLSEAMLRSDQPDSNNIAFAYPNKRDSFPIMKLGTPPFEGWNFWLQDGLIANRHYYSQAMAIKQLTQDFPWWTRGAVLMKVPIENEELQWSSCKQSLAPYHRFSDPEAFVYFGVAYLENTARAGWNNPDGFIYIYGRYERAMRPFNPWEQRIELAVARVPEAQFEKLDRWTYWTGDSWSNSIEDVRPMGLGGPELSVCPIPDGHPMSGKYLLISKHVRTDLYFRVGDQPQGPFSQPRRFYATGEEEYYGYPAYTYNAKAHPHLSTNQELLVSYHVNCPQRTFKNGDIYRPRFVWMDLKDVIIAEDSPTPKQ